MDHENKSSDNEKQPLVVSSDQTAANESNKIGNTGETQNASNTFMNQTNSTESSKTQKFSNNSMKSGVENTALGYFEVSGEKQKLLELSKNSHEIPNLLYGPKTKEEHYFTSTTSEKVASNGKHLDKARIDRVDIAGLDDIEQSISDNEINKQSGACKKGKQKLTFKKLSYQDKMTIALLAASHFSHMVGFSLMAPFFPREANNKGVSKTVTGFIFSCFELCIFISAPVYGTYLTKVGPSFMFSAGIFVAGICSILFGLLHYSPPTWFIVLCFITRSIEALGISAYTVASMAIASNKFPDHIGTIFGFMEAALSLGLMVGPLVGNLLYELGGYGLPFYVMGVFVFIIGLVVVCFLPKQEASPHSSDLSAWTLFKSGQVWVTALTVSTAAFAMGFIDPHLSLQLLKIGIPEMYIGFAFVIMPVCYAAMTPLWGWLTDYKGMRGPLIVGGNLISVFASLILGPSPYLPFLPQNTAMIITALVLFGVSLGCAIMPTMKCLLLGAHDVGFADNMATFGLVSGVFNSFYCLGSFLGPFVGGLLVDTFNFEVATTFNSFLFFFALLVSLVYFGYTYLRHRRMSDYVHLPLRIRSDEDSIVVGYNTDEETSIVNNLAVLSLSMRTGMSRHYL